MLRGHMGGRRKVHYNIRHVSAGRPVPYCHAVCEAHEVSLHVHEVTCAICCDFIDGFSVALDGRAETAARSASGARPALIAAVLAAGAAAAYAVWRHIL